MGYLDIFLTFLRLGLTSFGGPIAHLGYFHHEFVQKKKWINEHAYADLVTLCQFLPGPASSQVGMAIGLTRGGIFGAILAWIGFTLPSALILILFALGVNQYDSLLNQSLLHGLKVVAVAVVAQAVWGMSKKLCPDKERALIAILASLAVLYFKTSFTQIAVILTAGFLGVLFLKEKSNLPHVSVKSGLSKRTGTIFLTLFISILIISPIVREVYPEQWVKLFDSFYRAGSLVFGGGHVVLPLLQAEVVPSGWVNNDLFMAGYGLAQAIPGPLFAFSAYLGAVSNFPPNGWTGATLCLVAAFLPSFLLILGALPFWETLRNIPRIKLAMLGVNASVVGILLAALYHPVWTSAIFGIKDMALALGGFILLEFLKLPSWVVVLLTIALYFLLP